MARARVISGRAEGVSGSVLEEESRKPTDRLND